MLDCDFFEKKIPNILGEGYNINPQKISRSKNKSETLYEYTNDGQFHIIKIAIDCGNNRHIIEAQIDWNNYLGKNGISVCEVFPTKNGKLIETSYLHDHSITYFNMEHARGNSPDIGDWNEHLF